MQSVDACEAVMREAGHAWSPQTKSAVRRGWGLAARRHSSPHRRRCRRGAAGGNRDRLRDTSFPAARRPTGRCTPTSRRHRRSTRGRAARSASPTSCCGTRSIRTRALDRGASLLLGGADRPIRGGARPAARLGDRRGRGIRAHFERLLPALGNVAIAQAWEGRLANTPDSLPYVGRHRRIRATPSPSATAATA